MNTTTHSTDLDRATAIAATHYDDAYYLEAYIEGIYGQENPYDEATDPIRWAGFHRGHWRTMQTQESGDAG